MGVIVGVEEDVFTASSQVNGWEQSFNWNVLTEFEGSGDYWVAVQN